MYVTINIVIFSGHFSKFKWQFLIKSMILKSNQHYYNRFCLLSEINEKATLSINMPY